MAIFLLSSRHKLIMVSWSHEAGTATACSHLYKTLGIKIQPSIATIVD
jgi:hypothetical protein